jgi:hypothetical protein
VTNFIALYSGPSVAEARLIAVSSEPEIVSRFLRELAGADDAEKQDKIAARRSPHIVRGNEEPS